MICRFDRLPCLKLSASISWTVDQEIDYMCVVDPKVPSELAAARHTLMKPIVKELQELLQQSFTMIYIGTPPREE